MHVGVSESRENAFASAISNDCLLADVFFSILIGTDEDDLAVRNTYCICPYHLIVQSD